MAMPPRAPNAGPLTGKETIRVIQDGKPALATTGALMVAGPQGPSAYQVAVANGFQGTEQQWLASLQGAASKVPGPAGADAYEVAKAAGYAGTRAEWLASLKGAPGTPTRTEIVTATSNSSGAGTITFASPFAAPPLLVPMVTWSGGQMVAGSAASITVSGAAVTVMRSRGAILLNSSPFEVAPAGVVASFLAIGR